MCPIFRVPCPVFGCFTRCLSLILVRWVGWYCRGGILYKNLLCYDTAANSLCSPGWLPSSMLPDDGPVNDMWVYEPEGNEEHHLPVLFFGGQFTKMTDGSQCNGLIRVLWENNENVVSCVSNGLTFDSVQQSPGAGISFVIADSGSSFWVGGSFSYTTKSGDVIQNIAYFDGVNFVPVGSNDFPPVTASELHVSATSSIFFATASTNAAIVYLATRAEDNNGPISARVSILTLLYAAQLTALVKPNSAAWLWVWHRLWVLFSPTNPGSLSSALSHCKAT